MKEILEIAAEEFWAIGTVNYGPRYALAANNLHNLPEFRYYCWRYPRPVWDVQEQWYLDPLVD
jgi:hypothetical protein